MAYKINGENNWGAFAAVVLLAVIVFGILTYLFASSRNSAEIESVSEGDEDKTSENEGQNPDNGTFDQSKTFSPSLPIQQNSTDVSPVQQNPAQTGATQSPTQQTTTKPPTQTNPVQPSSTDTSKTETETPKPQTYLMNISGFAFAKSNLTITVGSTVKWTNKDSAAHTVTSTSGSELSSSELVPGGVYSHIFKKAGTYSYFCAYHPSMKGLVIVK